jgi:uncharacterized protein (TIGR02266 family)
MEKTQMKERGCRRIPASVGCWLLEVDGASCFDTFDLSEGGVCVQTDAPLPVGRVVHLGFYTPGSARPIRVEAEVVWGCSDDEPNTMGLKFMNLDDQAREAIRAYAGLLERQRRTGAGK